MSLLIISLVLFFKCMFLPNIVSLLPFLLYLLYSAFCPLPCLFPFLPCLLCSACCIFLPWQFPSLTCLLPSFTTLPALPSAFTYSNQFVALYLLSFLVPSALSLASILHSLAKLGCITRSTILNILIFNSIKCNKNACHLKTNRTTTCLLFSK